MEKSKYKNELGTINSDRNTEIGNFLIEQNKKGIFEMTEHISDFEEQKAEKLLTDFLLWYKSKQAVNTFDECKDSYVIGEYYKSVGFLLEQRFEVVNEDVATIKSDNSKVIAALQAKLEKAKELLREARDWMKEEASIKMRNGANRDVVDSYDDKAYKLTKFLEAK